MIMETNKFKLRLSPILEFVEDSYIKLIGDHWDDDDLEKVFKEMLNTTTKHTVHVKMLTSFENLIIFETSKYVMDEGYTDHQLWVFQKWMSGKYFIHLLRYNIL